MVKKAQTNDGFALIGIVLVFATVIASGFAAGTYFKNQQVRPSPTLQPTPSPEPKSTLIQVVDAQTKQPIPKAIITFTARAYCVQVVGVDCPDPTPTVLKTDDNGKIALHGSPPGDAVMATATGYQPSPEVELARFSEQTHTLVYDNDITIRLQPSK